MAPKILIVEDEPVVAMDLVEIAVAAGCEVVAVADRLSQVREVAAAGLDLALVDMNLVDGRSGPAVVAHLVDAFGVAVIFVTANIEQIPAGFCGAVGAVRKPFTPRAIAGAIAFAQRVRARATASCPPPDALVLPTRQAAVPT